MYHHQKCDVKTICYIVFISHSLHWHYIKTALHEYVITLYKILTFSTTERRSSSCIVLIRQFRFLMLEKLFLQISETGPVEKIKMLS